MAEITRSATSDDDWASAPESIQVDTYTPERGQADWADAVNVLGVLNHAARSLSLDAVNGCRSRLEAGEGHNVVAMVAMLQDVRRSLAETEAYLAREIGRDDMGQTSGTLPDGRLWTVKRGADRKAWSHADWQRDVRQQVLSGVPEILVEPNDGETVNVADLLAAVQAVHGSSAPKVTALKRLGLDPSDYCETYSGPFSVQVSAPGADVE